MSGNDRQRAICERDCNVIVDASAGTGKTSLVVERFVELVAPTDGRDAIPIERLAAITFTRKAAGELRVRTRQKILETLAGLEPGASRAAPLLRALGGIDTAHIGTIHGFADRLLRRWPGPAQLDPTYQLHDDDRPLREEMLELLIHAADTRTIGELLYGSPVADRADEATTTILDAQRAGLRVRSLETEHWTYCGLDALFAGFILNRDIEIREPIALELDRTTLERYAIEYLQLIEGTSTASSGGRWLVETGVVLRGALREEDPSTMYRELVDRFERGPRGRPSESPRLRQDFGEDKHAWGIWKALLGDEGKEPVRIGSLRDDLLGPLRQWLAHRLVRLRPVILHVFELVKGRHRAVDHLDLLLRLRNLLRDDRVIRSACQKSFDHLFVDEFQDTDPLQAEIVLFLCERGARAATWDSVELAPGTLTLVGDPKQSIYRFRRADIATYQRVLEIVMRSPVRSVTLTSSFRSAPGLVDWLNLRFDDVLGVSDDGARFRRETGEVFNQRLSHGRASGSDPTVHAVTMDLLEDGTAADYRKLEATTMARYLRWLVEVSPTEVIDPWSGVGRRIRYEDIGVLAMTTTQLSVLFEAFDCDDVPYAARGGTLFLSDPLHRRFLLGLSAIADRDDGVARAALLRPPFFAVDLADLARADKDDPADRVTRARAIISELRRRRFERSTGATARALIEDTGLGRMVALGPNGRQRLDGLYELCFQIELRAFSERLEFDAVAARVRTWIEHPQGLDRPHPVADAVRVMTVHQAKGLEFPVVLWWDARAPWRERVAHDAWTVDRSSTGWAIRLDKLRWDVPAELEIAARERKLREAERKRLVYVAATRARDLLIVPKVGRADPRWIAARLIGTTGSSTMLEQPIHTPAKHASWFDEACPPDRARPVATSRDTELNATWIERARSTTAERCRPVAFTTSLSRAHSSVARYGTLFGDTVHRAIGFALTVPLPPEEAVQRATSTTGLTVNLRHAIADVAGALASLSGLGLTAFELEYPVAGLTSNGRLASGYVDLVAMTSSGTILLDFKTDTPPEVGQPISRRYVDQVLGYAEVLQPAFGSTIRAGLLFTANGAIHWLSPDDNTRS